MNFKIQQLFRFHRAKLPVHYLTVRHSETVPSSTELVEGEESAEKKLTVLDNLKNLSVPFTTGYTCFLIKDCCVCPTKKTKSSNKTDIYINKKTGFFLCDQCKISGSWDKFNEFFTKAKDKSPKELSALKNEFSKYKLTTNWESIVSESSLLWESNEKDIEKVLYNFGLTKLNKDILKKLLVRINKSKDVLYFPMQSAGHVVGFKTLDLSRKSTTFPKSESSGCLIYSNSKKSAVVVASVHDFVTLLSVKLPNDIVCLPYGVSNLPQNTLPVFEPYEKLILWLGENSLNSTGNIAKKLNEKRCYIVRPTENQTSPEVASLNGDDIKTIISEAKNMCHDHIITFHALRDEVLSELQNKEMLAGVQWQRFPKLNKILKGHRRGELTVLTGPTGVGKTTFISEYSLDLAMQGVNTLWGSFEIKNSRLAKMMLQQFSGEPLGENVEEFNAVADKFEELPIFFMTFHGQQRISTVVDALEHCSYTYDIAHVIIDNVQFMIEIPQDSYKLDRFWKQDCLIQVFRNFATKNNCHVTLVMHPKKESTEELGVNSIFGGAKATQEADNILIIQKKAFSSTFEKKFLQVCKNRYSGDLGSMLLRFDKNSLSFKAKPIESFQERDHLNYREENNFRESLKFELDRDSEYKINY